MSNPDDPQDDEFVLEEMEAYCVRCKQTVEMHNPTPVWTRRGAPGTRGECAICGTTVFRMGRTEAHRELSPPDVSHLLEISQPPRRRGRRGEPVRRPAPRVRPVAYINHSHSDIQVAAQLAEDLGRIGMATWFEPDPTASEQVSWASGVHPALEECSHMVVVLSQAALESEKVREGWRFFRDRRKPVIVALVALCEVPDELRSRPRFDFTQDYKSAFREMVQALTG